MKWKINFALRNQLQSSQYPTHTNSTVMNNTSRALLASFFVFCNRFERFFAKRQHPVNWEKDWDRALERRIDPHRWVAENYQQLRPRDWNFKFNLDEEALEANIEKAVELAAKYWDAIRQNWNSHRPYWDWPQSNRMLTSDPYWNRYPRDWHRDWTHWNWNLMKSTLIWKTWNSKTLILTST